MAKFLWCRKTRLHTDLWPSVWSTRRSRLPACRSWSGLVGNMASSDVHVRICEQEILKYDLEIKALIQVRATHWCGDCWQCWFSRKAEQRGFSLALVLLAAIPAVADCCEWAVTSGTTASCLAQKNPQFYFSRRSNFNYVRDIKYVSKKC